MTTSEELKLLNAEVQKEFKEFNDMHRLLKEKKKRMYKLYARINVLWKKKINEVRHG